MKSVNYTSYNKLDCTCDDPVIICVDGSLTDSGAPYIEGTLAYFNSTLDNCGRTRYNYAITYDEGQLADPDYSLLESDIDGVVCKDCLYDYVKYYIDYFIDNCCDQGGGGDDWHILGNSGTVDGTNFCGTIDDVPFTVRVNNVRCQKSTYNAYTPIFEHGYSGNAVTTPGGAILSGGRATAAHAINPLDWTIDDTSVSVITGGEAGTISGACYGSCICAGQNNTISTQTALASDDNSVAYNSFIGAGYFNEAKETPHGAIVAGSRNWLEWDADLELWGVNSIIGAGYLNTITGAEEAGILSGSYNWVICSENCHICGGNGNILGRDLTLDDWTQDCNIGGGLDNHIYGVAQSVICGGECNYISSTGYLNRACWNSILGGINNELEDVICSSVLGGYGLKLGSWSVGFQGLEVVYSPPPDTWCDNEHIDISAWDHVAYFGDVDLWIGNVEGTARKIKFFEPNAISFSYVGVNYSSFEAQAQSADIEYVLPASKGVAGQVLKIQSVVGNRVNLYWANDLT